VSVFRAFKALVEGKLFLILCLLANSIGAQPFLSEKAFVEQLNLNGNFPEKLLSTRSVVFYSPEFQNTELMEAQGYFQRTGIDAVAYFPLDMVISGSDVRRGFYDLLAKREISNIVFLEKGEKYRITITVFNAKETLFDANQNSWSVTNPLFTEALKVLNRSASSQLKKQNLLINDAPEFDIPVNVILGKRNEFYAVDLKVDPLGIAKSGDALFDQELESLLTTNYPFKFKMFDVGTSEKEMRKQGYFYTLQIIRCRGSVARELLDYNINKAESAIVSVTFPDGGQQQLKNIPANTTIFKAYFKHIDSQNVFLGGKWDADVTWQQAVLNNIRALKYEMKIP
jgi:hypothetical protein